MKPDFPVLLSEETKNKLLEVSEFTPQRVGDKYITFLVEFSICYICKQGMIQKPKYPTVAFPHWNKINFDAQVRKSGLIIRSDVLVDDHFICVECEKGGKADFFCELCKTRKPTSKIKDWYGDPTSFLCWDCFNTVTAATWRAKVNHLCEKHQC